MFNKTITAKMYKLKILVFLSFEIGKNQLRFYLHASFTYANDL